MQTLFIVLLSIFAIMETYSQNKIIDRQPFAAGRFYSADKEILIKDLENLFESCKKSTGNGSIRALICPHAGYVFSGKTAAAAYSVIPKNIVFKNIFIIGSSHQVCFDGASVYNTGDFITPLGKITVNREIGNELILNNKVFDFPTNAHLREHSIEVQLPFIQYYFMEEPAIVPIIIGTNNETTVKKIAEALKPWFVPENLFVISSDFSHYPSYKDAIELDHLTALSIISCNSKKFLNTLNLNASKNIRGLSTSMCGWTSGLTLLYLVEGCSDLEMRLVDYTNSGDSPSGDKLEVVGYNAIAITEKPGNIQTNNDEDFCFSGEDERQLFTIARKSIESRLGINNTENSDFNTLSENIKNPFGAFVTLKINGILRGCIGSFISSEPLYKVVHESAFSSAFGDPRFSPLSKKEYFETEIEITVLGPLRKISNANEIVLGKHGIYIKKGNNLGTMLPQVAIENNWTIEEFLGYTSRDKAGIGWNGWKNAELFIYEGIVLKENK